MADSACFWDYPWHRRIRPVSHAVRKCILDTLHGSLLRRGGRLCHYPDVHFPSTCKIRQHDRRYVQKRIVYRRPFPVLYRIDGCHLLHDAGSYCPRLHSGCHFRRRLLRFAPICCPTSCCSARRRAKLAPAQFSNRSNI